MIQTSNHPDSSFPLLMPCSLHEWMDYVIEQAARERQAAKDTSSTEQPALLDGQ